MKRMLRLLIAVVVTIGFGCTARPLHQMQMDSQFIPGLQQQSERSATPKLALEVHPRVGFAPMRVNIRAELKNVIQTDPIFECIWKSWSFGDGARSSEKSGCGNPSGVERQFDTEHVYRKPGIYVVQFVLGDSQVLSNPVQIRVLGQ